MISVAKKLNCFTEFDLFMVLYFDKKWFISLNWNGGVIPNDGPPENSIVYKAIYKTADSSMNAPHTSQSLRNRVNHNHVAIDKYFMMPHYRS